MKKLLFIITAVMVLSSCATTKETKLSRKENRSEKKAVAQKAVEAKGFIVKLDRLHSPGRLIDLVPRSNYIIVDGERAVISAVYLGRQYDFRGISALDMLGRSLNYEMTNNSSKGKYEIKMKITNGNASFDVFLTIYKNGTCTASVSSLKIDYVRYSGYIVPIKETKTRTLSGSDMV